MKETPTTFYAWLMLVKKHGLKCAPLEAFQDERFNHAVSKTNANISFGFWDHRTASGFLDMDSTIFRKEQEALKKASEWDVFGKS